MNVSQDLLRNPALKVLVPLITSAFILLAARRRISDWRTALGLRAPSAKSFLTWVSAYMLLMLVTDALFHWRGPWDFTVWRNASFWHNAGRIAGVCVFGPIAEELTFRGVILYVLLKTRLGAVGAVLLTSVVWSFLHVQYGSAEILLIATGGILLGCARLSSGSLYTCFAMHILWNLYAIW